jgi:hypothetical protein
LSKTDQIKIKIAELLTYASTYISPAMVIGFNHIEDVQKLAIDNVNTSDLLPTMNSRGFPLMQGGLGLHPFARGSIPAGSLAYYRWCIDEVLSILSFSNS